ncbi:metal-dependent transcriptional regulator [Paeniglutamicibacter sp. Y32M11]|jgi:DtxR family Mn-dependent transcriptional regulator|uniref:metal-dependent transcriptional regulator n=1 Tax=Paeniglutamicibacter sp. Y32M11 TaxID=2853258 RepID=UPI0010495B8A|nr:metal-dependent transcriptional regulator [Paeniglutamicibacter sp. Y32M11]QXQ09131.1 metal-dependent transcriptional regulator [Paeniglutamicibacter sp. Y32M11]
MSPAPLTASEENYLKALHALTEWENDPVTTGNIAAQLGVAPASATSMVSKLAGKNLLIHPPYGAISFTEAGRLAALSVVRRHRLIETFLLKELDYGWDEVHEEAEQLEHTVSPRFIEALAARLGHPAADPHGDPIPGPDGAMVMPPAVRLDRFYAAGSPSQAIISRISDEDPAFLRLCTDLGISPGSTIELPHPELSIFDTTMLWVLAVPTDA